MKYIEILGKRVPVYNTREEAEHAVRVIREEAEQSARVIRDLRDSDYWESCAGKRGRIDFVKREVCYTDREGNKQSVILETLSFIEED